MISQGKEIFLAIFCVVIKIELCICSNELKLVCLCKRIDFEHGAVIVDKHVIQRLELGNGIAYGSFHVKTLSQVSCLSLCKSCFYVYLHPDYFFRVFFRKVLYGGATFAASYDHGTSTGTI